MTDATLSQAKIENARAVRREVGKLLEPAFTAVRAGATGDALQSAISESFDYDAWRDITFRAMERLRKAGALQPCTNLGDRDAPFEATRWNDYVATGLDPDAPGYEQRKINLTSQHLRHLAFLKFIGGGRPIREVDDLRSAREYAVNLEQAIVEFLVDGTIDASVTGRDMLECSITGQKLAANLDNWKMVLVDWATDEPVAAIQKTHHIRHMTIEAPSGILVLSDGSIAGFNAGLRKKVGERISLNTEAGLDMHTYKALEHAGIAEIYLAETAPCVWNEGELIRWGTVDDEALDATFDHDRPMATICDGDLMTDVLMASGEYGTRIDATRAIDAHHTLMIKAPEGQVLHVYAPSGDMDEAPEDLFARAGAPQRDGITDRILISFEPLDLDPDLVVEVQPNATAPTPGL